VERLALNEEHVDLISGNEQIGPTDVNLGLEDNVRNELTQTSPTSSEEMSTGLIMERVENEIRVYQRDDQRQLFGQRIDTMAMENAIWTEDGGMIQTTLTPQDPKSPENNPKVSTSDPRSILPPRINRGVPPKRYVPEDGTSKEYPIANYMTTEKLPERVKMFSEKMLSISVPKNVEEAQQDPKWVQAMENEMKALQKNDTWVLVDLPKGKKISRVQMGFHY
jgi:hypothetical protein